MDGATRNYKSASRKPGRGKRCCSRPAALDIMALPGTTAATRSSRKLRLRSLLLLLCQARIIPPAGTLLTLLPQRSEERWEFSNSINTSDWRLYLPPQPSNTFFLLFIVVCLSTCQARAIWWWVWVAFRHHHLFVFVPFFCVLSFCVSCLSSN